MASSTDTRSLYISFESASDEIEHNHYHPAVKSILSWEWTSLKPWRSHKIIGFLSGGFLNILSPRLGYLPPSSSSSLCHVPKNFSNQHIFAYSKGNSRTNRFKRRVFNLFSRRALPTTHVHGLETGMKSGTCSTMYAGPGFIAPRRKAGSREWHSFRSSLAGVFVFSWIYSVVYYAVERKSSLSLSLSLSLTLRLPVYARREFRR